MHTLLVPRAGQSQYCCSAAPAYKGRVEALSVEAELLQEGRKKSGGNVTSPISMGVHILMNAFLPPSSYFLQMVKLNTEATLQKRVQFIYKPR